MAITQRVQLGKWHNVYNRRKRLVGEWAVYKTDKGYTYKGYGFNKWGSTEWDLTGENPEYPTAVEAAQAAIENVLKPD